MWGEGRRLFDMKRRNESLIEHMQLIMCDCSKGSPCR